MAGKTQLLNDRAIAGEWLAWLAQEQAGRRWLVERALDLLIIVSLIIHTSAPVAVLTKLAGTTHSHLAGYIWLLAAVIGFGLFAVTPIRATLLGLKILPFVLLTGWVFATFVWSISPYETLRGAIYLAAGHLTAVVMAARFSWRRILILLTIALAATVVPAVLLAIAVPGLGRMQEIHPGAWSGVWMEKQSMGFFSCQLMIVAAALVAADRKFWPTLVLVAFGILGVWGSTGRSAMVISALALASVPAVLYYNGGRLRAVFMPWLALVTGGLLALALTSGAANLLKLLGRGSDLTGRVEIWLEVGNLIEERPMQGYGYNAIWRMRDDLTAPFQWIAQNSGFEPFNAHSSWLEAQLGLGLPGLVLLIACMIFVWCLVIINLRGNKAGAVFSFASLLTLTVISFTESILLNQMDLQWFVIVLIAAKMLAPDPAPAQAPTGGLAQRTGHDSMGHFDDEAYCFRDLGRPHG